MPEYMPEQEERPDEEAEETAPQELAGDDAAAGTVDEPIEPAADDLLEQGATEYSTDAGEDDAGEAAARQVAANAAALAAAESAAAAEPEEEPEPEEPAQPKIQPVEGSQWYILQTYSGFENRVKKTIEEKLRVANLGHLVEEVFVPGEDVTRVKSGRKRTQHVIYFPGYVLVKMKLTDELWHLLMDIPRVAGFVGGNNREPQPLSESELSHIRSQMSEGFRQATLKEEFEVGQQVIVIDGPFANFSGKIDEVNVEKSKLRVLISILGRSTPVELDFDKVKAHPDAG